MSEKTDDARLSELIWRTFKWRVVLLVLALVAGFAVASTLDIGTRALRKMDDDFVAQQLSDLSSLGLDAKLVQSFRDTAASSEPGLFISVCYKILTVGQMIFTANADAEVSPKLRQGIDERVRQFDDHFSKRKNAFLVAINVPYLSAPVSVNAGEVADVWPACALVVLCIVALLGFQQLTYEIMLTDQIAKSRSAQEMSRRMVLAQFSTGVLYDSKSDGSGPVVYRARYWIQPSSLVVLSLTAVIALVSGKLLGAYNPTENHPTDSILSFYYTGYLALFFAGALLLGFARGYFLRSAGEAIGRKVRGHLGLMVSDRLDYLRRWQDDRDRRWAIGRNLTAALAVVAFGSLFFGWTIPKNVADYSGVDFLRAQREINPPQPTGNGLDAKLEAMEKREKRLQESIDMGGQGTSARDAKKIQIYPFSPEVFAQFRWHLVFALAFIALCVLDQFVRGGALDRRLREARGWGAIVIFFLACNLIAFFGVLLYQSQTNYYEPFLQMIFGLMVPNGSTGFPMFMYQPTLAFWVFFGACGLLVLTSRPPRLIVKWSQG